MACRGCTKSGLALLSRRSATTCALEARSTTLSLSAANTRLISSSTRPTVNQQQRNQRQRSTIATASRSLHTPAKRSGPAETEIKPTEGSTSAAEKPVVGNLAKILKAAVGGVGGTNNTYAIYGVTQNWAKLCASQADYSISKEDRKADRVKTTEEGEEVGVSKGGVWHDGLFSPLSPPDLPTSGTQRSAQY